MPKLTYKRNVNASGVQPPAWLATGVALVIYSRHGLDLIVTSYTNGQHSRQSFHYSGFAVDLRTWHIPNESLKRVILAELLEVLEPLGYFVQYEPTVREGDRIIRGEHFHVHYSPGHGARQIPPTVGKYEEE